jgi:hypothetical protein
LQEIGFFCFSSLATRSASISFASLQNACPSFVSDGKI